jgi:predicted phosphodiesterase
MTFARHQRSDTTTVSFAILSDLHLETPAARPSYSKFSFNHTRPHLVLLGDIGLVSDTRLFSFLEEQLLRFETVFYVLGNHEPHDSTMEATKEALRKF